MAKSVVWAAGAAVALAFSASIQAAPVEAGVSEAPVIIPVVDGEWVLEGMATDRPRFRQTPLLAYRAAVFPNLLFNLVQLECGGAGGQRIEVTGLMPAQRFPQPRIALRIGGREWSAIPNAGYHPRSAPKASSNLPDSMLDDNLKGKDHSWPGHPAYADLSFFLARDPGLLEALRSGGSIRLNFEGQQSLFPAIPPELAARYVQACAQPGPPIISSR